MTVRFLRSTVSTTVNQIHQFKFKFFFGGAHTFLACFARIAKSMPESAPALKFSRGGGGGLMHFSARQKNYAFYSSIEFARILPEFRPMFAQILH